MQTLSTEHTTTKRANSHTTLLLSVVHVLEVKANEYTFIPGFRWYIFVMLIKSNWEAEEDIGERTTMRTPLRTPMRTRACTTWRLTHIYMCVCVYTHTHIHIIEVTG